MLTNKIHNFSTFLTVSFFIMMMTLNYQMNLVCKFHTIYIKLIHESSCCYQFLLNSNDLIKQRVIDFILVSFSSFFLLHNFQRGLKIDVMAKPAKTSWKDMKSMFLLKQTWNICFLLAVKGHSPFERNPGLQFLLPGPKFAWGILCNKLPIEECPVLIILYH